MQRRFLPFLWACTLLLFPMQAAAQDQPASYVVAPFQVNGPAGYSYLEKAVPPMLSSRLFWQGKFEPAAGQDAALQGAAPKSKDAADSLRGTHKADYVIWGSVTVLGDEASLDISVMDGTGKSWQRASKTAVNNLIGALQSTADAINSDVFGRPVAATAQTAGSGRTVTPMNPDFVMNESDAAVAYMNPQIRYQGGEAERLRSQMLDFESHGMAVADIDGDGRNEILLLESMNLYAYRWENGRLVKLAEYRLPSMIDPLLVRTIRQNGRTLIVLTGFDNSSNDPVSSILSFSGGALRPVVARAPYFLNVVPLPPLYEPAIIGQGGERTRIVRGPVFEMSVQGDRLEKGAKVPNLPKEANVFNFTWIPGNANSGGDYLAVLNEQENLLTFDGKGNRLAKSDDKFSGSGVGIPFDRTMPGMGSSNDDDDYQFYYIPMRMIAEDLDKDGRTELVLNKPISAAAMIFHNYRTYPQGEIHALLWDGIGMDLLWKTRRIKGTVADLVVADADNDGVLDLTVNVNSYPGTLGMSKIRNLVTLYPLNSGATQARDF
ncbi:MAG: VCBS repeat-containing protein [Desulfovibrionaceae bacterium]|nr:VCBS repeat-containing protein [Desulfovibrionaceae bacterium]